MEWSHALLGAREQALFRRLSVFGGSFGLDAAEAVCVGGPLEMDDILDGVSALVDKSLVTMEAGEGSARYRMLETVRQYAAERLAEAGETHALRDAHLRFFVDFAEHAEPYLFAGAGSAEWIGRVASEVDDLRVAAQHAEEDGRTEEALRLAYALHWFWFATGQFREARQRLEVALAAGGSAAPLRRGRALLALAFTAIAQADVAVIRPSLERALDLLRGVDEPRNIAYALACLAAGALMEGDCATALRYGDEALETLAAVPPHAVHSFVRYYHGRAAEACGDLARARQSYEEATRIGRDLDHSPAIAHPLAMLGRLELSAGELDAAHAHFIESLVLHAMTRDIWGGTIVLDGLAAVGAGRGDHAGAARLFGVTDSARARIASALPPAERAERDRIMSQLRATLGDAYDRAYAEGASMPLEKVVCIALGHDTWQAMTSAPPRRPSGAMVIPRLRVLALGPLQVYAGNRLIEGSAWGSARPRELLAYLLMHPEGRTKEQVGLAFWPDASPAQLRNSFHVTLHRLRKALGGSEWITLVDDRYRVEPELLEELDVAAFEREVAEARRALKRQEEGAAARLEQALARYRGDFLDGEPVGDWHLEHRERLQRTYMDALLELGAQLTREERHAKAAEAFRRVLVRDELHEDALQALMKCHAALGERSQAMRVYKRFADRLREELDAEPQVGTVRLYERLQAGS
jgi:DNA-binding SARP family transcriptional activator